MADNQTNLAPEPIRFTDAAVAETDTSITVTLPANTGAALILR